MGEYLAQQILNRMYDHPTPLFKSGITVRDIFDNKVFEVTYAGYHAGKGFHQYTLRDSNTGEMYYENPEGYLEHRCEVVKVPCT